MRFLLLALAASLGHTALTAAETGLAAIPQGLAEQLLFYLDSMGLSASIANRLLLRQAAPTHRQILFWDRVLVRLSRTMDPILRYSIGKSLLGVWRKPAC